MHNIKHTVVGLLTIGMIGTMSCKQIYSINTSNRIASLLNKNSEVSTYLTPQSIRLSDTDQFLDKTYTQEELLAFTNKKSVFQNAYVLLTNGSLNVYNNPSEEAEIIDNLAACTVCKSITASLGAVGLCYHQNYFVSRFANRFKRSNGKVGRAHKNYLHSASSISSASYISIALSI